MGDLFWNKVFGALLAVVLGVMGLQTLSDMVFSSGEGGHHGEEEQSLNEWAQSRFNYYTEIAETGGAGGEADGDARDEARAAALEEHTALVGEQQADDEEEDDAHDEL